MSDRESGSLSFAEVPAALWPIRDARGHTRSLQTLCAVCHLLQRHPTAPRTPQPWPLAPGAGAGAPRQLAKPRAASQLPPPLGPGERPGRERDSVAGGTEARGVVAAPVQTGAIHGADHRAALTVPQPSCPAPLVPGSVRPTSHPSSPGQDCNARSPWCQPCCWSPSTVSPRRWGAGGRCCRRVADNGTGRPDHSICGGKYSSSNRAQNPARVGGDGALAIAASPSQTWRGVTPVRAGPAA